MVKTLKEKTAQGLLWSIVDKTGQQTIQVLLGIALAWLLTPADFGLVGMLTLFVMLATLFQESGFSAALIREQNATQTDYSSVFYLNIFISAVCYLLLFFLAPAIAAFFSQPRLVPIARVLFCGFVLNSLGIVQYIRLNKTFDFKSLARISIWSVFLSGLLGLGAALSGYGVWALVIQSVSMAFFRTLFLWMFGKWRPSLLFDKNSVRRMYAFSAKLLLTNVITHLSNNLYPTLIGKYFPVTAVGYYTQAYKWQILPLDAIATPVQKVSYPLLSELQDDPERQKRVFRKLVKVTSFISFPLILGFAFVIKEAVWLILSEKWANSIILMQLLAVGATFYPLYCLFISALQAGGSPGLILKTETTKNLLIILNLFCTIRFGMNALIIGMGIINILFFLIIYLLSRRHISYKWHELAKDILPFLLSVVAIILLNSYVSGWIHQTFWILIYKIAATAVLYLLLLRTIQPEIIDETMRFLRKKNIGDPE